MRPTQFGPWREVKSAQGIIYYYNSQTEISQWEKPAEWRQYDEQLLQGYQQEQERQLSYWQCPPFIAPAPLNYNPNVPPPPPSVPGWQNAPLKVQQPPPPPSHPSTDHEFAKPMLPAPKSSRLSTISVGSSSSRLVTPEAATINVRHRNASSPGNISAQSSDKAHPYAASRIIAVGNNTPDALISSPAADVDRRLSTARTSHLVFTNSPHLDKTNNKRNLQEVGNDTEQIAMKKARDMPATDWRLAPWARFYKPELAKKLREKMQIERIDEFITMRDASFILERKLIDKFVRLKAVSAIKEIQKHEATIEGIKKDALEQHQQQIRELEKRRRLLKASSAVPMDHS